MRSNPSNLPSILAVLLPIPPKYHFKEPGQCTALKEQQILNQEGLTNIFQLIFSPLDMLFNAGKFMLCADSWTGEIYLDICEWTVDYFENIHLHSIIQPH